MHKIGVISDTHGLLREEVKKQLKGCDARRFQLPITMAILEISFDGTYRVQKNDLRAEGIRAGGTDIEEIVTEMDELAGRDRKRVIQAVMREVDRKTPVETIAEKQKLSLQMAEQICRLYVTHPGVDADGILNKMDKK